MPLQAILMTTKTKEIFCVEKGAQAPRDLVPLGYLHGRMRAKGCNQTRPHHGVAFCTFSSPLEIQWLEGGTGRGICWRTLQPKCTPQVLPLRPVAACSGGDSRPAPWLTVTHPYVQHDGLGNHLRVHRNPLKGSLQPGEDLQEGFGLLSVVVSTQLSSFLTRNPWFVPGKRG